MKLLALGLFGVTMLSRAASSDRLPSNVEVVELHQTESALLETYHDKPKMALPRVVVLNAQGKLVYASVGLSTRLSQDLHTAVRRSVTVDSPISLDKVLEEVVAGDGHTLTTKDLPTADLYVVDYWAEWCSPCRMLDRDLSSIMSRWDDKKFVWLKVESDPQKISPQ